MIAGFHEADPQIRLAEGAETGPPVLPGGIFLFMEFEGPAQEVRDFRLAGRIGVVEGSQNFVAETAATVDCAGPDSRIAADSMPSMGAPFSRFPISLSALDNER